MYGSCDAVAWRQVARTLHQQTVTLVRKMGVLTSQGYPSPSHTLTYTGHTRHAGREGTLHSAHTTAAHCHSHGFGSGSLVSLLVQVTEQSVFPPHLDQFVGGARSGFLVTLYWSRHHQLIPTHVCGCALWCGTPDISLSQLMNTAGSGPGRIEKRRPCNNQFQCSD